MKPISPKEVIEKQHKMVSDLVIKIFNDMITSSWDGIRACVNKEKLREILTNKGYNFETMMNQGGLKIEPLFREQGWHVEYGGGWWTFSIPREKSIVETQQ